MNNEIQIFNYEGFGDVRTMTIDDEPWFVGKDVAEALGYATPRRAIRDHVDEEDKGGAKWNTLGGTQRLTIINESGLYALIFGSKLESARRFKRWVTSEVLPTLRKTHSYSMNDDAPDNDFFNVLQLVNTCSKDRLPYILSMLRQKGYDVSECTLPKNEIKENRLPELLKGVPLVALSRKTGVSRTSLWQYKTGRYRPYDDRYNMLVAVLEQ